MAFQADLLRVLEDGVFTPFGTTQALKSDFRLVTATNLDLVKGRSIRSVEPEVLALLRGYPFSGNIRELENIIEYAFVTCKGPMIRLNHLPRDLYMGNDVQANSGRSNVSAADNPEAQKIQAVLDRCGGNRLKACRALGISHATLWRKIGKFGLG